MFSYFQFSSLMYRHRLKNAAFEQNVIKESISVRKEHRFKNLCKNFKPKIIKGS